MAIDANTHISVCRKSASSKVPAYKSLFWYCPSACRVVSLIFAPRALHLRSIHFISLLEPSSVCLPGLEFRSSYVRYHMLVTRSKHKFQEPSRARGSISSSGAALTYDSLKLFPSGIDIQIGSMRLRYLSNASSQTDPEQISDEYARGSDDLVLWYSSNSAKHMP